ncbi:hypothetical protein KUV65_06545 [Maritalea mobilis]|uniref:hypothetical protein n=1 Tax=Maritalea mobilis TaxID=483324 RepID=UPI001C9819EC|nr:hypothetical protein [Maritalea mobilis]MBY6201014.1 hypothetical protein [Maritalea mobilis]
MDRTSHRIGGLACAAVLCIAASAAEAACSMSDAEFRALPERAALVLQWQERMSAKNGPEMMGALLGAQRVHVGDDLHRQDVFDCLFERFEQMFALEMLEFMGGIGSGDGELAADRFRAAAFGLLSGAELLALGIDPDMSVESIFADPTVAVGILDAAAVCAGNGLPAGCTLSENSLSIALGDTGVVEGQGRITLVRPGTDGQPGGSATACADWVITSELTLIGRRLDDGTGLTGRAAGDLSVVSHVAGELGASCTPFTRDVPMSGTWTAEIDAAGLTGEFVMPGAQGTAAVPFALSWREGG